MREFRVANEGDFLAVRSLLAATGLVHEDLTPEHLRTFLLLAAPDDPAVLVAVGGLEIFSGSEEGLLRSVAVEPEQRGQHIGQSLVGVLETWGREKGVRRLWLLTTTAPAFFRRLGFTDTARAQAPATVQQSNEFKSLCPASAVCLSKLI